MLLGAAVILASTIYGQKKDSAQLDPVIVTANKISQKQSQTGKVISVINKEQIEKSAGKTVGQLLNEQAGLTINGANNALGTNQSVYMRGTGSGRTLILLDGIPVNDPSNITNDFDLNLFSLNDVESIEICRGAQSTLYGSDAIAGVINIITVKKDITKPFNVKATGAAGNLGMYKGNVQVYGKADKLTYTARYAHLQTTGVSSAYDSTGKGNFDKDGYNGNVANASLQYQVTNQFLVKAFGQYSQYKTDIDGGIFADDKGYTINNKNLVAGAGFQYKNDVVTLTGNYQYNDTKRYYLDDSTSHPGSYYKSNYYGKTNFAEMYANIKLGAGFSLVEGADYRYSNMNINGYSYYAPFTYPSIVKDSTVSQAALYSSLMYNGLNEKLNIELGGRLNVNSRYGSNATYTFNPSYKLAEHYRVFGSISTGFKAPSLYQLYSAYGNANLKAEKSTNYEIGVQQQYATVSNRLVFFYSEINNGLDYNYLTNKYFNIDHQTVRGLEYEMAVKITKALSITGNYTYLSSTVYTQSRVNYHDTSYNYSLRVPKHNVNITVGYQITDGFYASISGKYVSSREDVGGYKKPDALLNDYFLLNGYAEYKFKDKLKLFANFQNITDKKYFDIRGYNSLPFNFTAGFTVEL